MTDSRLKEVISYYIDKHEQEMLADLMALVRINSEKSEPKKGKPYGAGPYEALMAAKELCDNYGFATKVYDNRVISADMTAFEPQLDILAHMDVVPGGDGWTVCDPYNPVIRDGAVYGRGSSDDKGPAIAALYAMRAVKELRLPLSRNCRLILGSDEECGSSDIEYYYKVEQEAPMTFSPDAEFPVINVEKGRLSGTVMWAGGASDNSHKKGAVNAYCGDNAFTTDDAEAKPMTGVYGTAAGKAHAEISDYGVRLIACSSGHTLNIVPDKAEAWIAGIEEAELVKLVQQIKAETGAEFTYEVNVGKHQDDMKCSGKAKRRKKGGNSVEADPATDSDNKYADASNGFKAAELLQLKLAGTGAHASTPEKGVNALTLMLALLAKLPYADQAYGEAITKLAALFPYGDHEGEQIAAACEDSIAGKTTVSPDIFTADEQKIVLKFDARTCLKAEEPDIDSISRIKARAEQEGFRFEHGFVHAHAVDGSSDFVRTLLSCYESVTGKKGACVAVGGGTYVHELKNGVAFGAVGETTDTHMHGNDEFMLISELKAAAVIYALAIVKLCS